MLVRATFPKLCQKGREVLYPCPRHRARPPCAEGSWRCCSSLRVGLKPSTVLHLPLDQMAIRADQIFTGEVLGVTSQMNARGTGIYTFVTIAVNEYLKGGRRSVLTLRILGGEAEGYRLVVPGSPTFRLGEEVLVFTDGGAGRIPTVLGMAAGKFALERDPVTGEQILERSLAGLTLQDSRGDPVAPPSNSSDDHASLADVRQIVREALVAQ